MKCPHCQAENPEEAVFCIKCGLKILEDTILKCPECNTELPDGAVFCFKCGHSLAKPVPEPSEPSKTTTVEPTSFVNKRYQVKKKLGEGGKKKVYLVHDKVLDRDVAFALIKTENLDEPGRKRVLREAQAMGKLGDHPNIMSIHDMGQIDGQPYIVIPNMSGGDVEGLIEKVPDHRLSLDQTINIAKAVCQGLIFAHSNGVIHRDLKPGNVWLTDDGTARIGDFGLAVMTDVSRLTMEGMMVGTVSYMPPEQAGVGEVTPKADLYSLGAMLYEMVTGRPPFVGDDSISVIGQHINAQPISPTWHRADLPAAFESLIMLLLEKDADKRPGSAKDVLAVLESIEKGDIKEQTVETQVPTQNPLYRRVFVGRENELKQLQDTFIGAMSGQGALTMVVGEPGIGKTAVCDQLSTFVTLRGGMTLWGHCYEEGSLSLPYLAFVEAMRSYVMDREADDLKKELGSGATEVARIVSEIREKLHVEPREAQNPEEDRYRLMQAVTSFLKNAAAVKPMLVILEDLHDADKGTLEMLSYVSRNLSGTRLLIIGTYRDIEVDRSHPLSAALAELRRVSTFGRVLLRGLSIVEVRRMLESLTQEDIPVGLAEAVHRQTEGNPLFVQEVVRYLTEEKLLVRESGKMIATGDTPLDMNIPEGLRDVIGKRLSNLSAECNELLSVASVIGREFALDTLKAVADMSDVAFVNALKESVQLSILEERSQLGEIRYRFTHAFFRQTLYEELIAPQRLYIHQQVARSMETLYEKRLEEHASELAEHFSHSTDHADLEKAVNYGEMAARRAMSVYAYSEAAHLLDQTIKVQKILDPNDKEKLCDLILDLCDALSPIPDIDRIIDVEVPAAFSIAEELNDSSLAVRACLLAEKAYAEGRASEFDSRREWLEKADRYALPGTVERVLVDGQLGVVKWWLGDMHEGEKILLGAIEQARHLEDQSLLSQSIATLVSMRNTPQHASENLRLTEELRVNLLKTGMIDQATRAMALMLNSYLKLGQRKQAEKFYKEYQSVFERTGNIHLEAWVTYAECTLKIMDGQLEEAIQRFEESKLHRERLGLFEEAGAIMSPMTLLRVFIHLGKTYEVPEDFARTYEGRVTNCLALAHQGKKEEALKIIERYVLKRPNIGTDDDYIPLFADTILLEASVHIGHSQASEMLYNRLNGTDVRTGGPRALTCVTRHLGGAAVLLKRYDKAREHYNDAIKVCTEMPFRPELALSRLQLAELLLDQYPDEKKEATEHLDFVIQEFREMKMQPSLERALRRKDILKA
ncbi:protein kinase [Chloroflexota bacterium]